MIIVTFDSLLKHIKTHISGFCDNMEPIRPLPKEYTLTGKVITRNISYNKLYASF